MIALDFERSGGLIPAIAQDASTHEILMQAWINEEAFAETLRTGCAVYYSRSRRKLWRKGEESGHVQRIREILVDCDADSVIYLVDQIGGAACHTGHRSCYFRRVDRANERLEEIADRVFDPDKIYGQKENKHEK